MWAIFNNVDCSKCNEEIAKIRGCKEPLASPKKIMICGNEFEFDRCPRLLITGETQLLIEAYGHYKNGLLPNAGTWLDQPQKLFQAFELLGFYINKLSEGQSNGRHKS